MSKIFKKIGDFIEDAVDFVKDHWKEIVIAAAVVFTAGVATVGFSGLSAAYSAAIASGANAFTAVLKVAGSTLWAGATSIAGTFGVGKGASGFVAEAAGMQGATLLTGAAAQSLGLAAKGGSLVPGAGANVGQYTGPFSKYIGSEGALFGDLGAKPAPTGKPKTPVSGGESKVQGPPKPTQGPPKPSTPSTPGVTQQVTQEAGKKRFLDTLGGAMLIQGGIGAAQGYMQGRALEEQEPLALFGMNLDGSMPSYVLPGMVNPQTGKIITPAEAEAINTAHAATAPKPPPQPTVPGG